MIQIPHEFFFAECVKLGVHLPPFGRYGVGVIFFPKEIRLREECREIFARAAEKLGLEILAYRKVPVNTTDIGPTALSVEPEMEHVFIACPDHIQDSEEFERKLFVLRNYAAHTINNTVKKDSIGFYISPSLTKQLRTKVSLPACGYAATLPDLTNKKSGKCFRVGAFRICYQYIPFVEAGTAIPLHCT